MAGIQDTIGEFENIYTEFNFGGVGIAKFLDNNPRRVAFIISSLNTFGFSPSPQMTPARGLIIAGNINPIERFTFRDFGALTCGEWYVDTGGGIVFSVIETIWSPER